MGKVFILFLNLLFGLSVCLISASTVSAQTLDSEKTALQSEITAQELSVQWTRESIERSFNLYSETAAQWIRLRKPLKAVFCLRESARQSLTLGDKAKARSLFGQALKILNQNDFLEERIKVFGEMSLLEFDEGNVKKSKSYFENALLLAKNCDSFSAKAAAHFSAAEFYYFNDDLHNAQNYYLQSIEFWKKSGDVRGEAKTMVNLAYLYLQQYEFDLSIVTFNSALSKWKEIEDLRGQTLTIKALGDAYNFINEKQKALNFFKDAEQFFPPNIDFKEKAVLMNNIGSIYDIYENWDLAQHYHQTALELFKKDGYIYGQIATLPSLGRLAFLKGNKTLALKYFSQAEKLAVQMNNKYFVAITNLELASLYLLDSNYQQSLKGFQKALSLIEPKQNKRLASRLLNKIGEIYLHNTEYPLAKKYFSESLELNKSVKDNFSESETLFQLARLQNLEGAVIDAIKSAKGSIEITELLSSDVLNSKLKSTYLSNVFDRYALYINLLMKRQKQTQVKNFAVEALQLAEKSRARSMFENLSLSEANFTIDADVETVKREKEIRVLLNAKEDKLTDLLSNNADKSETDKLDGEISQFDHELEEIKAKLKQNSPIYSAIKNPAPFDVGEFQRDVLDDNSLLLEFSFGKDESYLWLVGKNEVSSYVLPPREQIEARVEKLRGLIASREMKQGEAIEDYQKRIAEAEADYRMESRELSNELFGQIGDKLSNKRLIIVPDGKLHYFPVSALPLPNSESNEPILLTNETVYEPSAQTLLLLEKSRKQSAATKNLLVFSDPIFTNDDTRFSPDNKPVETVETASVDKFRFVESLNSLSRLTASKDESDTIVNIVGASESDVYSGFAANREQLLNIKAEDYKILHFATHGFTNEQRPELSSIILSRFNEKGQKLDESFRIHDIYGLNLNADLVVLSACETGIGKEVKGEGLMSLNNAFLQTGAKSVMASLWKVEDTATLELMKNFYSEMEGENLTPSQALRQAQIKLRQNPQYQSPFYWAAFTVQGDFRNVPKISHRSNLWIYFLGLIPLSLVGIYLYRRRFLRVKCL